ncbi:MULTISPECIES: anti-sigma factor family protein [unclassified Streptomyces]|uniref:anti-sigma factor family protein n=1 Tax=unclassified Streptomyces TaxID=2593676 RepID=UPI003D7553AB
MTSTTDMTGHPDVTEISDLVEGLLSPTQATDLRRHLDGCALCADVQASLEEVQDLLGSLPEPEPMPDEVAQRIEDALAEERTSATEGAAFRVSRETSAPDRPAGHARAAGTGPGRKERPRRGRRKIAVLGAVFGAAALSLGSVLVSSLLNGDTSDDPTAHRHSTAADTFAATTLRQHVSTLLAQDTGSRTPYGLGMEGGADTQSPRVLTQPTVPACVEKAIGKQDTALATEPGVYQGRTVLLVVLPDASDSTRVTAYLVDTACLQHPSVRAEVLLKDTYVRP